jgi:hypothetical protein
MKIVFNHKKRGKNFNKAKKNKYKDKTKALKEAIIIQ